MWFFNSPEFFFGEGALSQLEELHGRRAMIVIDANLVELGYAHVVQEHLHKAGIESRLFSEVEPDPSLQTVRRGAQAMLNYEPDWIIGLGGGSCLDAAKAMWILYERPEVDPASINPMDTLGMRQKARLVTIPTTAGSGAEASYGIVLTDTEAKRKLTLGSREVIADYAIVDPYFTTHLPRQITADTGIDVLSHAIEAYSCTWANDFTDGLCLQAAHLVMTYLPRAVEHGAADAEAREKMANAAAIAGITLGNSQVALGHALGHTAGPYFKHIPHGRITAIFVPYSIEFVANAEVGRYAGLARVLGLPADDQKQAALSLAAAMRDLMHRIGLPLSLQEAGVARDAIQAVLPILIEHADMDANLLMSRRIPTTEEIEQLFWYAYKGKAVDF